MCLPLAVVRFGHAALQCERKTQCPVSSEVHGWPEGPAVTAASLLAPLPALEAAGICDGCFICNLPTMRRTIPKLVVLVAVAVHLVQRGRQTAPAAFEPVADGLYRSVHSDGIVLACCARRLGVASVPPPGCPAAAAASSSRRNSLLTCTCSLTEGWKPLPFLSLPGCPIAVYAVRDGSNWVLVDAGVPALASQLLDALRALVPPTDKLAAIVCEPVAGIVPSVCAAVALVRIDPCNVCPHVRGCSRIFVGRSHRATRPLACSSCALQYSTP